MVQAIFFDLDETLCDYRRSSAELLETAFEKSGVEPFFTVEDYYDVMERRHIAETESKVERRRMRFELVAENKGVSREKAREVAEAYAEERDYTDVEFVEGVPETLDILKKDYGLGLVTNGEREMQEQKLESLGITDFFEPRVFAGDGTEPKPSKTPFEVALEEAVLKPYEVAYVGNSISSDVKGSNRAGLISVWFRYSDQGSEGEDGDWDWNGDRDGAKGMGMKPDYIVDSITEITDYF